MDRIGRREDASDPRAARNARRDDAPARLRATEATFGDTGVAGGDTARVLGDTTR
jgi:hypothetical protein